MRTQFLSLAVAIAFVSSSFAQTTTYLDFEGAVPTNSTFGGSDFSIVDNPSKTGVNTSNKVAQTLKSGSGIEVWGGTAFPCGGNIGFTSTEQTFTIDIYSAVTGIVNFKLEQGAQGNSEVNVNYTTPNAWQTLTIDMSKGAAGTLNPDYKQIVVFLGFGTKDEDVWYYDNIKGPKFIAGDSVDVIFSITDLEGTANSMEVEFSNAPGVKVPLTGTAGIGAVWTTELTQVAGSTILAPISYTLFVNGAAVPEITDQPFVMAGSVASTIAKNYGSPPVGQNLITNGGFDNIDGVLAGAVGNSWGMYTQNGGTAEIINGVCTVTPVQGAENYFMQVEQRNVPLENDKTYIVNFDMWGAANRKIALTIEDPANGYAQLGSSDNEGAYVINGEKRSKWDINISSVKTTYELMLNVDGIKANTIVKFAFLLAQTSEMVYIDNVSIKEENTSVPKTMASSSLPIYPNPANDFVYIKGLVGDRIDIYSITGKNVMTKVATSEVDKLDVSGLATGVYMLKVGNDTKKLIVN